MKTAKHEKVHASQSDQQQKHIAFFSTRPYEKALYSELLETVSVDNDKPIKVVFFEVKNIDLNNLEFQMTYPTYQYKSTSFILACLLIALIFVFVYPTFFFMASHYAVLSFENNFFMML